VLLEVVGFMASTGSVGARVEVKDHPAPSLVGESETSAAFSELGVDAGRLLADSGHGE
jgi:hypothetical protein